METADSLRVRKVAAMGLSGGESARPGIEPCGGRSDATGLMEVRPSPQLALLLFPLIPTGLMVLTWPQEIRHAGDRRAAERLMCMICRGGGGGVLLTHRMARVSKGQEWTPAFVCLLEMLFSGQMQISYLWWCLVSLGRPSIMTRSHER